MAKRSFIIKYEYPDGKGGIKVEYGSTTLSRREAQIVTGQLNKNSSRVKHSYILKSEAEAEQEAAKQKFPTLPGNLKNALEAAGITNDEDILESLEAILNGEQWIKGVGPASKNTLEETYS